MTIHSNINYQCKFCDTHFIPIPEASVCPNCGITAGKVFHRFVQGTLVSVRYNLKHFHDVLPPIWRPCTIGDFYYMNAFLFLSFVCAGVPVSRRRILRRTFSSREIVELTNAFMEIYPLEAARRSSFQTYFSLLLACNDQQQK